MWISGAYVLSLGFHVTLDPERLVILGLTCMARCEKVKMRTIWPIGGLEQEVGGGCYLCSNDSRLCVCLYFCLCEDKFGLHFLESEGI